MKITIEIRKIGNGFVLEESYFGEDFYFKTFEEAVKRANKIFKDFGKENI